MSTYPKLLWSPEGVEVSVQSAGEEAARVAEGYRETAEPPVEPERDPATFGPPDDGTGEGPTFGPPDDDTHAKSAHKKK